MPDFFQKAILHYSAGFTAPQDYIIYSIEISSNRYARLHVSDAYTSSGEPDSSQIGYFEGVLADSSFSRLNDYFSIVDIDELESEPGGIIIADAPYYNFIIFQQDKRKSVEYRVALQQELQEINDYLYFLCRNNQLPRTTIPFVIEE